LPALQHGPALAGLHHRRARGVGVPVGHRGRAARQPAGALGDQAALQVDVLPALAGPGIALPQQLPGVAVQAVQQPLAGGPRPHPTPVGVVAVALHAAHRAQAVAVVEVVGQAVAADQVPLHVVAQRDHRAAVAAAGLHAAQAVVLVAVPVVAAGADQVDDVVQDVVRVMRPGAAVHRGGDLRQPVQAVVGHGPVAALVAPGGAVGDRGDVADLVVVVDVVQDLGGAVGVLAFLRQAAGVLRQGVDDAVAVGELLQRAVGEVAYAAGER